MTIQYEIQAAQSVDIMDRDDIIPDKVREEYANLPEELKYKSEEELRNTGKIRRLDESLRMAFWRELQVSLNTKKKMIAKRVYVGLCSEQHFYRIIKTPERLAWITSPVIPYENRTEALLTMAVSRYEEILNMPITSKKMVITGVNEDGKPVKELSEEIDPFKAKLLMETIKNLEERVKGLSVQRQVTVHEKPDADGNVKDLTDMSKVDERIKELESKLGVPKDTVIEAEVVSNDD